MKCSGLLQTRFSFCDKNRAFTFSFYGIIMVKMKNIISFLSNIFDILLFRVYYDLARDGKDAVPEEVTS